MTNLFAINAYISPVFALLDTKYVYFGKIVSREIIKIQFEKVN